MMHTQQTQQQQKQFIPVTISSDIKKAVWHSFELEQQKKIKADQLQVIFVLLELNPMTGTPKSIIKVYNDVQTHTPSVDSKGNRVPAMMLYPFKTMKNNPYFKCDNCGMTGQERGYYSLNQYQIKYTFCSNCLEGH